MGPGKKGKVEVFFSKAVTDANAACLEGVNSCTNTGLRSIFAICTFCGSPLPFIVAGNSIGKCRGGRLHSFG